MRQKTAWLLAAGLVASASSRAGEERPATPPVPGEKQAVETEVTVDEGTRLTLGIGFSHPLGATARVGLLHGLKADVREEDGRVKAVCAVPIPHCAQGFLVELEAGSGGGKVSVGLGARAQVDEEDFRGSAGLGLRLSLARTWGTPFGVEPGLTYLGPELDVSLWHVDVGLGVLWRLSGRQGPLALFSWHLGFGL
jgi:hypothetical protein